ncbi:unnamed protein product [Rotaria magnacalcarata]|uniref:Protein kinase domain-containing protein n=1 Tax=Rotaria magnacalcarata TaxID=392030 RepID=A0A819YF50_9BILA|nr:unnamed protein product [Rotaria magnacalcarata]CAF4157250.1 unnamed protein product [Rotaria magnacalcarata]
MKIKFSGWSCSSNFCIVQEVHPNDIIEDVILKIEQAIPCTRITKVIHNGRKLNKTKSFAYYEISNGTLIAVQTDTEDATSRKTVCMGCSYYNLVLLSANVARVHETRSQFSQEATNASIHQWIQKLNSNDQTKIIQFINSATDGHKTRFMVCIKDMFEAYVTKYRNTEYANLIDFDYCELLNELRCPVCCTKFSLHSHSPITPIQLCTISDKHYTCHRCFNKVKCCPLCNGELHAEAVTSKYAMNLLWTSKQKIEVYCLPTELTNIDIKDNQRPFAHGAFCNVYKVENYALKCPRVPTLIDCDIEDAIIHEIFLSRPLNHIPNVLIVYGGIRLPTYGMSIVMEFVDGPSLAKALYDGTILNLTFEERLDIALGVCKGLGELHLAGIVHRDFKPANVLLKKVSNGHGYIPKIADFGVSFLIQTASATAVQKLGGTVGYDAPEVADGNTPSFQSDIYALSFTLYELLTVQHPFMGLKDTQIITKYTIKGERPKDWSILANNPTANILPGMLKDVIEKGWLPTSEDRASIGEIIYAIRKTISSDYKSCARKLWEHFYYSNKNSSYQYDFIDKYNTFELLAIQEIIKRLVIEDSEAVQLLLNNYAWG